MTVWCRLTVLAADGSIRRTDIIEGAGRPDLAAVDELARRTLAAIRAGDRVVVGAPTPEMRDLIELVALPVEMEGQAEGGEQPLGVEEVQKEGHLGDPPV